MKYNALTLIYHMHRRLDTAIGKGDEEGVGKSCREKAIFHLVWDCVMPTQRLQYRLCPGNGNGNENGNRVVSEAALKSRNEKRQHTYTHTKVAS